MPISRFKRTKSRCKDCPLNGRNVVSSRCDIDAPFIAVIGEAPGADEDAAEARLSGETDLEFRRKEKGPFVGAAGNMFKYACGQAGIMWHTLYKMNVINCRPTNNHIDTDEAREAIECCRPGFEQELAYVKSLGVRVLVPVGGTALNAIGLEGKISSCRGSVYVIDKNLIAIPTYHPSYIIRGAIKEEPVWIADLHKAFELSMKKYVPPKERFNINPTIAEVEAFAKKAVANKTTLYVDIEHHGGFNPDWNKITMIGFGTSGEDVMVVPFTKDGQFNYWHNGDELRAWKAIRSMLASCPTVYQHALHDVYQLEMKGHRVGNVLHDTLLMHHVIHPELPHDLEYITSVYGNTPSWKGVMKGSKTHMIDKPDDVSRTYNARDTAVLAQVIPPMLKDLKAEGVEKTYFDISMKLVRPFVEMMKNGIKVDPERLKKFKQTLKCKETKILKRLYDEIELPPEFNLDSPEQVKYLLYGIVPPGYEKAKAEKAAIEASTKSKTTKKYLDLVAKCKRIDDVTPLYKTRSMVQNTDEEALLSIKQQALNRLSIIDCLQRPTKAHKEEERDIERLLLFIDLFLEWSGISKQVSTYTKYPLLRDGRVHTSLGIHGTATGRPNSRDPNLLNVPKEVRDIFVPEKGNCFVQGDYKNLEVFVLGFLTEEPFILDAFKKGISLHDMNAKILFDVEIKKKGDKGYEEYNKFRQAAKKFAFGLNYGGGIQGIYRKILLEVPDFKLSFAAFTKCYNDYFKKLPKYAQWRKLVQDTVTGRSKEELPWVGYRWIRNAFGRKRMFLGTLDEIEREALNCVDFATEALSKRGWLRGDEIRPSDELLCKDAITGDMIWERPVDIRLWPDKVVDVTKFSHPTMSAVSTKDHRWLVTDHKLRKDICVTTETMDVHGAHAIHRTGNYRNNVELFDDDFVILLGWVLTDGTYKKGTKGTTGIVISQSPWGNAEKVKEINELWRRLKYPYKVTKNPWPQCTTWFFSGELATKIRELAPDRVASMKLLTSLSSRQCNILLDTMIKGDGSVEANDQHRRLTVRDEPRAIAAQILGTLCGYNTSYKWRDFSKYHPKVSGPMRNSPKMNGVFIVHFRKRNKTQILRKHRSETTVKGVWCPIVPSTFFVARRKGTVFITGNTPIQGTAADVTNPAIIDLYAKLQTPAWKSKGVKLLLTVYDSILVECKKEDKLAVAKLLKSTMERDFVINGKKRHFAADIEASDDSWYKMEEIKL